MAKTEEVRYVLLLLGSCKRQFHLGHILVTQIPCFLHSRAGLPQSRIIGVIEEDQPFKASGKRLQQSLGNLRSLAI